MVKKAAIIATISVFVFAASVSWAEDTLWELQGVNADGTGSHPKVGAAPDEANKVIIEGISLASTGEVDAPTDPGFAWFSLWLQAEDGRGGIQVWSGPWSSSVWQGYSVQAGDRVRVVGWVADHNGKVFMNDRHSLATMWSMEVVSHGAMPEPELIPSIATCNYFDVTRQGGAEYYQTRWVRLNGVRIASGEWGAGNEIVITDSSGADLTLLLSSQGTFGTAPTGEFDVMGIFDQEDAETPFDGGYRLWIRKAEDILPRSMVPSWDLYE
ncbi:MAG TPA: hypothetical protein PK395_16900 [bacterium]|nr:hypothetical protein [bacterium]